MQAEVACHSGAVQWSMTSKDTVLSGGCYQAECSTFLDQGRTRRRVKLVEALGALNRAKVGRVLCITAATGARVAWGGHYNADIITLVISSWA